MIIKVFYINGDEDIFDTNTLTSNGSLSNLHDVVMTKFHITWGEFMKEEKPSHLNIYAYYYRKNNDQGSLITNEQYLDEVLFYDNDRRLYNNLTGEQIKQKNKALPYGSMEPGTWFTLVPVSYKNNILRIDIDNVTRIYRHHSYNELIDIFKFNQLENQYLDSDMQKASLEYRINSLFNNLKLNYTSDDGCLLKDESDIAYEMGMPYSLIFAIKENIEKLENYSEHKPEDNNGVFTNRHFNSSHVGIVLF